MAVSTRMAAPESRRVTTRASARLSRRLFVRRAVRASAGLWLTQWAACSEDRATSAAGDAGLDAGGGHASGDASTDAARDASLADAALGDAAAGSVACAPFLTPLSEFFVQFGAQGTRPNWAMPDLDTGSYRLVIDGEVRTPLTLSWSDLDSIRPQVTVLDTIQCVFGPHGTAIFRGVPVRALLDRAGIDRTATRRVLFVGADGFRNNLRIEDLYGIPAAAERAEPFVALRMDDRPIPREHGFPARLVAPGRYGFKNIKWLARIEATRSDAEVGDYQEAGIARDAAVIVPNSLYHGTFRLRGGAPGAVTLCGQALSGHAGIERVEISVDGAAFVRARLVSLEPLLAAEPRLADTLQATRDFAFPYLGVVTLWEHDFVAQPGEHDVVLRIRDRAGEIGDGYRGTVVFDG